MEKFKKQLVANKQILVTILITFLIAGLLGFYGGRYYEREVFRQGFANRRGTMMQNRTDSNDNYYNRGNMMNNGQYYQGPNNR